MAKRQVRNGVFETNSSSEHSLTVMNRDKFNDWKEGKLLARKKSSTEGGMTWGNFWSRMITFEFTDDFEQAKKDNEKLIEEYKQKGIKSENKYKQDCLNHKKLIEKKLSDDEISMLTPELEAEYFDKLYEDEIYDFKEDQYNYWMEIYNNLNFESFKEHIGLTSNKMWMTFEQFLDDYIHSGDCQSPFEHDDEENNVHIIGKYYRT